MTSFMKCPPLWPAKLGLEMRTTNKGKPCALNAQTCLTRSTLKLYSGGYSEVFFSNLSELQALISLEALVPTKSRKTRNIRPDQKKEEI